MSGWTINFDFVKAVELPGDSLTFGNYICYDIADLKDLAITIH